MKAIFTYRALVHGAKDIEDKANWSAAPHTEDPALLAARAEAIRALPREPLLRAIDLGPSLATVQPDLPRARRVEIVLNGIIPRLDAERSILYVVVDAQLRVLDAGGVEIGTDEYDYLATQLVMDALERAVG